MSLTQRLEQDMKAAMKNKDKAKLGVIRMLRSAIKNMEIERGRPLEEDEVLDVLARELKQRKESLQEFEKAGRSELAEKVKAEIAVVETYLARPLVPRGASGIGPASDRRGGSFNPCGHGQGDEGDHPPRQGTSRWQGSEPDRPPIAGITG